MNSLHLSLLPQRLLGPSGYHVQYAERLCFYRLCFLLSPFILFSPFLANFSCSLSIFFLCLLLSSFIDLFLSLVFFVLCTIFTVLPTQNVNPIRFKFELNFEPTMFALKLDMNEFGHYQVILCRTCFHRVLGRQITTHGCVWMYVEAEGVLISFTYTVPI